MTNSRRALALPKRGDLSDRESDIIRSIIESDREGVAAALDEDAEAVNAIHEPTGMNAVMLASSGRLDLFVNDMAEWSQYLDFSHVDKRGRNLLEVALSSLHPPTVKEVQAIYEMHAPHIINNWPGPSFGN